MDESLFSRLSNRLCPYTANRGECCYQLRFSWPILSPLWRLRSLQPGALKSCKGTAKRQRRARLRSSPFAAQVSFGLSKDRARAMPSRWRVRHPVQVHLLSVRYFHARCKVPIIYIPPPTTRQRIDGTKNKTKKTVVSGNRYTAATDNTNNNQPETEMRNPHFFIATFPPILALAATLHHVDIGGTAG
jgi:hypothetical protein